MDADNKQQDKINPFPKCFRSTTCFSYDMTLYHKIVHENKKVLPKTGIHRSHPRRRPPFFERGCHSCDHAYEITARASISSGLPCVNTDDAAIFTRRTTEHLLKDNEFCLVINPTLKIKVSKKV